LQSGRLNKRRRFIDINDYKSYKRMQIMLELIVSKIISNNQIEYLGNKTVRKVWTIRT